MLKAAVIGVGYLGGFHAQKYATIPQVELTAVVDPDPHKAEAVAAKTGSRALADYRELLGEVDLVSIVVPPAAHFEIARDFLQADAHVLVEKPITRTVAQADELIALARARKRVLQVGHLERFNPAIMALHGELLNPMFIESHRIAQFQPRGTDVSVVLDLMIHDIDIILSIVKSDLVAIRPMGLPVLTDNIDIANARLEFANGCIASVTASRVSRAPMRKVRIFQADAYMSIDYNDNSIIICRREPDPEATGTDFRVTENQRRFDKADTLLLEIQSFVHAVETGCPPEVSGEDGRRALEVALQIGTALAYEHDITLGRNLSVDRDVSL
jgi:predicted dehydrogenase